MKEKNTFLFKTYFDLSNIFRNIDKNYISLKFEELKEISIYEDFQYDDSFLKKSWDFIF